MKIQAYLRISVIFLSLIHISSSIHFLNSLDFLTEEEKQMILYKNARVFLGTMDIISGNNVKNNPG